MPSIFVWKATVSNVSIQTITYYSGSNWFLEEHGQTSSSYMYINQYQTKEFIAYHATKMPQNWVGSELLETIQVPYQCMKEDEYGSLDHIGNWFRFTSKQDYRFENIEKEFEKINVWMNSEKHIIHKQSNLNSEECLIKFTPPTYFKQHKQPYNPNHKSYHKQHHKLHNHSQSILQHNQNEFAIVFSS
jgi:hypothetical protein